MKKLIFALALILTAAMVAQAQSTPAKTTAKEMPASKVAGPKMSFEAEVVDYGSIQQGADPFRVFKFKNEGSEPLLITGARGSCGCTVPTYPQEPILPGQTAVI